MREIQEKGKYIYREKFLYEFDDYGAEQGEERHYIIAVIDKNGVECPHPITDFLRSYRSKSMSLERERQVASTVCQFLNFSRKMTVLNDKDFQSLRYEGIFGLNFEHASRFLRHADDKKNLAGRRVKKDTVDRKEKVLIDFYIFFQENGIISPNLTVPSYIDEKGKRKYSSPFVRTRGAYNTEVVKKGLRDFGENRQQLLVELIDTALSLKKGKSIAFGMALQAFGGLRRGEIVNLTTGSILHSGNTIVVDIKDRQNHLFKHKKNTKKEAVKKPRLQDVLPSAYINKVREAHNNWLKLHKSKVKFIVSDSLFVNKLGYPMSGKTYETTFKKVVEVFLKRLLEQRRYEDFSFLTSKPINTHTLRGVFTNICLDDLGMNVRETANARGDNWDKTVVEYMEELTGKQKMQRAIEQLANAVIDNEHSKDVIANWRDGANKI
ncbi:hypothetical protein [Priestia sp. YIM B13489]|uniref:hypothetical protein n=1 Tax=Priestia sp. YIM B13489 TaxID=3366313 RepID=UPI00366BB02D